MVIEKIISGGQTGADRAALDWAIENNIPHGGWCPKGRKAEDCPIDLRYNLKETASSDYLQRNEWNVRDSDGTAVFTIDSKMTGGSHRTTLFAREQGRPWTHIGANFHGNQAPEALRNFIQRNNIKVLNVAGSRASKEPGIGPFVTEVLSKGIDPLDVHAQAEFIKSWEYVEQFYEDNVLRFQRFFPVPHAQLLIKELRSKGYDQIFRAGQSLYYLMLSRSWLHGLGAGQPYIIFEFKKDGMDVIAKLQTPKAIPDVTITLTEEIELLLKQLAAEPIT